MGRLKVRMAAQEGSRGVTVKDVAAQDFVIAYAAHLKRIGKIEVPKWADLVKTAAFKELAPYDQDWYYIRAAAIARRVYLRGDVGVGAFKKIFGGRAHRKGRRITPQGRRDLDSIAGQIGAK